MARGGIDQCPNCFRGRHGQCDDPSCVCCGAGYDDDEAETGFLGHGRPPPAPLPGIDARDNTSVRLVQAG